MAFTHSRALSAVIAALLLAGCGGGGATRAVAPDGPKPKILSFDRLPKGMPRPLAQGDSLAKVSKDTTPQINLSQQQLDALNRQMLAHGARGPARAGRAPHNVTTESPREHGAIGTNIYNQFAGVYATQSGWQGFKVADGNVILGRDPNGNFTYNVVFADTTKEPGGCFESGSGYWSYLSAFYVFDFCRNGGEFVVVKTFQTGPWFQYAQTFADGTQTYTIENYRSADGTDHALLFNRQTNAWEELYSEPSGATRTARTDGWSITEYYNEPRQGGGPGGGAAGPGYCQPLGFSSQMDNTYRAVTATAYGLDYGSYTMETFANFYNADFINNNSHGGPSSCLSTSQDGKFPAYQFNYDNWTIDQVTSTWSAVAGGSF